MVATKLKEQLSPHFQKGCHSTNFRRPLVGKETIKGKERIGKGKVQKEAERI